MKNKISPLMKDTLRTIKKTITRFLAIIAMTGLSAIVFIGLQAVIPNLRETILKRVQDNQIHDLRVHSYAGLRSEDRKILEALEGDNHIEYMSSEVFDVKGKEFSINLFTATKDIDTPLITEGRFPRNTSEILLDDKYRLDFGSQIGQEITFINKKDQEDKDILSKETFTIVGYGKSVDYISNSRISTASSGDYFGVVKKEVLYEKYPDYALVRLERNKDMDISTKKFKHFEAKNLADIKKSFENRPDEVKKEILKDAYDKIDEAKDKIEDGKNQIKDGQKKLDDSKIDLDKAKKDLDDGKNELIDSKKTLDDSKKKLDDAKVELEDNKKVLEDSKAQLDDGFEKLNQSKEELEQAKIELDDSKKQLYAGYKELSDNEKLFQEKIKEGQEKFDQGQAQYDEGKEKLDQAKAQYQEGLDKFNEETSQAKKILDENKAKLDQAKIEIDQGLAQYQEGLAKIEAGIAQIQAGIDQIDTGIGQINANIPKGMTREIAEALGLKEVIALFDKIDELEAQKKALEEQLAGLEEKKAELALQKQALDQAQKDYEQGLIAYQNGLKEFEEKTRPAREKLEAAKKEIDQGQKDLDASKEKLDQGKKQLEEEKKSGQDQLAKARADLEKGQADYDQGLAKYQDGLKKYQDGKAELDENYAKYEDGLAKFKQGQKDYEDGLKKYQDGLKKYEQGQKDYQDGLKKYQDGLKEYEDGKKTFEEEKIKAEEDIRKAEEDIRQHEKDLEDIVIPNYRIEGIYNNRSFNGFISQISSLNYMSLIFTAMFYLVAILVTLTTVLRMVETERTQIGTLKALGYNQFKILGKFLIYGLLAAVTGSILGSIIGQFVLMPPIANAYISSTNLDLITYKINYVNPVIILLASVLIVGFTIYFTIHRSLREEPANLMRPKPPAEAKRILLEKIPFIWNRLSFLNKVSIRNVVRHKLRVIMIILGVAGSFGLIAMAFGIQNSVGNVGQRQFGDVYKYHAQLIYDDKKDDFEEMNKSLEEQSSAKISIISEQASVLTPDGFEQEISIQATDDPKGFLDFVNLRKRGTKENYDLEDGKVIITEKLSMILNLSKGDIFKFIDKDGLEHKLEVQAITEQYFDHLAYMTKKTYQETVNAKAENNSYLIKLKDYTEDKAKALKISNSKYESSLAFIPISDLENTLESLSDSLNLVILMIIAVSALLTFVVLYNLTNINISERYREIATIKVLGFRPGEVSSYIFKENYILTLIGILFGMILAKTMHSIIVFSLSSESFLFDPVMNIMSFVWATIAIVAFMILVIILAKREMNRINMVEALKDF